MDTSMTSVAPKRRARAPKIVIDADHLPHIEGLAESAMQRNPTLADRLFDEIGRARIVPHRKMPQDAVTIGSAVTYRDETTGQERSVVLVYPQDADIALRRVSLMTPIGVALLGLREGSALHWDTRSNERRTLTVVHVGPPPAAPDTAAG